MDLNVLKKLTGWIACHGFSAYTSENITRDLNINTPHLSTPTAVIETLFFCVLDNAQKETTIQNPNSEDELFDLILTFFEKLADYKSDLKKIAFKKEFNFQYLKLPGLTEKLSSKIFYNFIQTSLDKFTYNLFFLKIFYVWLKDETKDFSNTSHEINYLIKLVSSPS